MLRHRRRLSGFQYSREKYLIYFLQYYTFHSSVWIKPKNNDSKKLQKKFENF